MTYLYPLKAPSMKTLSALFMLLLLTMQSFAQSDSTSLKKDTVYWVHQYAYDRIIQSKIFKKGMSDDEMAGILLYKGGNNLKGAFACEFFGVLAASLIITVNENNEGVRTTLAVLGGTFFIVGIISLVSGYNKISKAGIILQHKGINIKTTGTGISFNF
jgi:hypothetical protein